MAGGCAAGGAGRIGSCGWSEVEVGEDDALAGHGGFELAQGEDHGLGGFRGGSGGGGEMQAGDAAGEPEAGEAGEVCGGGWRFDGEDDADAVGAGLAEKMVEVVEVGHGAVAAGSGEGGRGKQQGIDAEGAQGVETDGEGFEVDRGGRRDLIEDGVTPPGVGAGAGSGEAGAGHALGGEARCGCEEQGGEGQETAMGPVRRGRAVRGRARPGVGGGDRHR